MSDEWLTPLSPEARRLLVAERGRDEDESLKARAIERAQATIDGERASGISVRPAFDGPLLGVRSRPRRVALLAAAAMALVGLAAAGMLLREEPAAPSAALPPAVTETVAPHRPSTPLRPRLVAEAEPDASADPPLPSSGGPGSVPSSRVRSNSINQYAIELGLLEPARSHIARGDYSAALAAIGRHHREYPNGQLAEEREALRVRALWSLGRIQAAEAAAASFKKRYPRSSLLSWMKHEPAP